jgi:hypothetical protein
VAASGRLGSMRATMSSTVHTWSVRPAMRGKLAPVTP